MKTLKTLMAAVAMVALTGTAQAALVDRGGGMIYDSTLDITWLADMNYAKTNGDDSDGLMTWADADAWADGLSYGGHNDWRLPSLDPSDTTCSEHNNPGAGIPEGYYGYDCTGGELSHLFVADLGNDDGLTVLDQTNDTIVQKANLALFSNVQSYDYWSGTEYAPLLGFAWGFTADEGYQGFAGKDHALYALAVRPGDVAASVPEPRTLALALLALGAAAVARKRRPA